MLFRIRLSYILLILIFANESYCLELTSHDLDVSKNGKHAWVMQLEGIIETGDARKIYDLIRSKKNWPITIKLRNIPGGDVYEALLLGKLITRGLIKVQITGDCASACTLIVMSAYRRGLGIEPWERYGEVSLHRPFFKNDDFSKLKGNDADETYSSILLYLSDFMEKRQVPSDIREIIYKTPSNDAVTMTASEFIDRLGEYYPPHHEWLISKCREYELSSILDDDRNDLLIMGLQAVESDAEHGLNGEDGPELNKFMNSMLGRYLQLLTDKKKEYWDCEKSAVNEDRAASFEELIKYDSLDTYFKSWD